MTNADCTVLRDIACVSLSRGNDFAFDDDRLLFLGVAVVAAVGVAIVTAVVTTVVTVVTAVAVVTAVVAVVIVANVTVIIVVVVCSGDTSRDATNIAMATERLHSYRDAAFAPAHSDESSTNASTRTSQNLSQ